VLYWYLVFAFLFAFLRKYFVLDLLVRFEIAKFARQCQVPTSAFSHTHTLLPSVCVSTERWARQL
jgi:hypothetical protein